MSHFPTKAELKAGVERLSAESGGVLTLNVVRSRDVGHLLTDASFGDAEAQALVSAVLATVRRVSDAPERQPALCASCPAAVRKGSRFAIVIARGAIDCPTQGLGMVICNRCGPTPGAVRAAAATGLKNFWPDLRPIEITHGEGGRA